MTGSEEGLGSPSTNLVGMVLLFPHQELGQLYHYWGFLEGYNESLALATLALYVQISLPREILLSKYTM